MDEPVTKGDLIRYLKSLSGVYTKLINEGKNNLDTRCSQKRVIVDGLIRKIEKEVNPDGSEETGEQ